MILIGNGRVLTRNEQNPWLEDGCIAIKDNLIVDIGPTSVLHSKYPKTQFVDVGKKLIMPALINPHMHFYSTFARGMAMPSAPAQNFIEILEKLWWRLDKVLTMEDVFYSALVPLVNSIKYGVTTIFDHHASPMALSNSLFKIAEAVKNAGIRGCLCYEVSDRDGKDIANSGIQENIDFINYCKHSSDDMLKGMFGLHASLTLHEVTLKKCAQVNADTGVGFHIHVAEDIADQKNSLANYNERVINRLNRHGLLGEKSIAVHCVHITEDEKSILKINNTAVVHNAQSNMGNAVGCSPVLDMFSKGIMLGLGTDGYTSNMFESYKIANILHKHNAGNPSVSWVEIPQMLFNNNALIANRYFQTPLGKLSVGYSADIIIVEYDPPTPMDERNANNHILFGISGPKVTDTMANGRFLMRNRKLLTLDEEKIIYLSRELSAKLWKRI